MPLIKSTSKQAFSSNVKKEVDAGKPLKQSLAIAYATKREASKRPIANVQPETRHHSSHIEELGSAYESNSVSSGREPSYHPVVQASMKSSKE